VDHYGCRQQSFVHRYEINGRQGKRHFGHEILLTKSLGAIRQSASQVGTGKQGDFCGQGGSREVEPQEENIVPLYCGKTSLPVQESSSGYHCRSWFSMHKDEREPTIEDWEKMNKLLGYLKGTKEFVMRLKPNALFRVDASFLAHPDGKSHSGVVVKVGGAPLFFSSKKQKCVSKSPTEAELVALSDNIGFAELFAEFVAFVMNSEQMKPLIYQDSTSVITMVTEGEA
jgi:hypothetical protein